MLTILMPYYDNPNMLRRHLQEWRSYDRRDAELIDAIIVDDGSPTSSASNIVREFGNLPFRIRVYRVDVDIPWNQDGARNLGMSMVNAQWVLMTDMDHMLSRSNVTKVLMFAATQARRGTYYMPTRIRPARGTGLAELPHPNSYLMHKEDFWEIGGYDEDFAGSYGSDGNFRKNARGLGLDEKMTQDFHLIQFTGDDIADSRTTRYSRKDGPYYRANFPHLEDKRRAPAYRSINPLRFPWHEERI